MENENQENTAVEKSKEDGGGADHISETVSVEDLQKALDDFNDRHLRLAAEFDNYKKRMTQELERQKKFAVEKFASELLDVIDNLERAAAADDANLREGLGQIQELFGSILERYSIEAIDACGTSFNPELHEAIAYVPSDADEGIVIDEVVRGYRMRDKVIRHAKVIVSRGKEE